MKPLPPSCLKVLGAILSADRPLSYRELAARCGVKSACGPWLRDCVLRLEEAGLVRREARKARTLVPSCRFIPAERLEDS